MFSPRAFLYGASAIAIIAGTVATTSPAIAADSGPASKPIETVVVTAERRNVDLQKTTLAATVLTGEDMANKAVFNLTSLQFAAPGITINDYGSANVFNMRGVGREAVDIEIPSGVAIYRDGVPTLAGYFQGEPYFDMSGIEVLRGPQGTFAGQSASGGAVFIRTRNPVLNELSGNAQAGLANYDQHEFEGAVNIPLSDTVAIRVAYNHLDRDRWYHLTGTFTGHPGTREMDNARVSLYWQPSESFEVLFKSDIGQVDFGGNPVSTAGAPLFTIQLDDPMKYLDKSYREVLDGKYHFANGITLRSLTGVQNVSTVNNLDADGGGPFPPVPPGPAHNSFKSQGNFFFYSQEFNLVSPEDQQLRWVLGLFAERQVSRIPDWFKTGQDGFTFTGFFGFSTAFPVLTSPWIQKEDDFAVFASTEYDIDPSLTLETGLRYSYNHRHQFTDFELGFGTTPPFFPLNPGAHTQTASGDYIDGKIALQWKPTDIDFAYIQAARGHTVRAINIFPPNDPYKPVEVWDYEAGWKTSWFDNRLRTQLDAYFENIGNYQAVFGFTTGGGLGGIVNGSETRNAETRSKIWGIEASGQGSFGDLGIDFGAAYLHSAIGRYSNVINQFSVAPVLFPPFVLGNPVAAAEAAAFGDAACQTAVPILTLDGAKAPFSPDVTGNLGVQYAVHTGSSWVVTPRGDVAYQSSNQADLFKCSLETIKSRTLLNLQVRVDSVDSPWFGLVWMTNATNEHYVSAIQNIPTIYYAGPPMQVGVRIGRTF